MRGEKHDNLKPEDNEEGTPTRKLSPIAVIVDREGNTVYYVHSSRWANGILVLFTLMLIISLLLAGAIYLNYRRSTILEKRLEQKND